MRQRNISILLSLMVVRSSYILSGWFLLASMCFVQRVVNGSANPSGRDTKPHFLQRNAIEISAPDNDDSQLERKKQDYKGENFKKSPMPTYSVVPSVSPSVSHQPSVSFQPSVAPSDRPSFAPTTSPTSVPSSIPSMMPSRTPTDAPSISMPPSISPAPTRNAYILISESKSRNGSNGMVSTCPEETVPVEAGPVARQNIAFEYDITFRDAVEIADTAAVGVAAVENVLHYRLSRAFLGNCSEFTNARDDVGIFQLSSDPRDEIMETKSSTCANHPSCVTVKAAFTADVFYRIRRRRTLQETSDLTDPLLAEIFANFLTTFFANYTAADITYLSFRGITNFAGDGLPFGNNGSPTTENGGSSDIAKNQSSQNSMSAFSWGAFVLALAIIIPLAILGFAIARKRKRLKKEKRQVLESTLHSPDDQDNKSGGRVRGHLHPSNQEVEYDTEEGEVEDGMQEGDDDSGYPKVHVLGDYMNTDGDSGVDISPRGSRSATDRSLHKTRPPLFISTRKNRDSQFDPYSDRSFATPDTLDL